MQLKILRWGDFPGLSEWDKCNQTPYKSEVRGSKSDREDMITVEKETVNQGV